jgi:transcriptional regulator with XRE-family HTH domain
VEKPLGERIRTRRQLKGWTLKDLAEATELSVPYLSDLERRSGVNPTLDTLTTLATAFGCSVAELVGNDGTQATAPPPSLARFVRSGEFQREVKRLAERTKTSESDIEHRLIDFLAVAPRRSTGDLTSDDWRRLLDVFTLISDES